MQRRFAQLVPIIQLTLLGIATVVMFGAVFCLIGSQFYSSKAHLMWIWLPGGDWRFRLMMCEHGLELRTCFGGVTNDYSPAPFLAFCLVWLSFGVIILGYIVQLFGHLILKSTKPKPEITPEPQPN